MRAKRYASKNRPLIWNRKPLRTNLISPKDAIIVPTTMKTMFSHVLPVDTSKPREVVAVRMAAGPRPYHMALATKGLAVLR